MNYNKIIKCGELNDRLGNENWRVFDCRFSLSDVSAGRRGYDKGHIPGAIYADLEKDLSAEKTSNSGRHPLPRMDDFVRKVEEWGISPDSQIVVYDDAGGVFAGRLWWMLRWIGHKNVALLDGGLPAWERRGLSITTELQSANPITPKKYQAQTQEAFFVSTTDVKNNLNPQAFKLLDARGRERFTGEKEPVDPVGGHIPHAINLPYTVNLDENGCFLTPEKLRERFEPLVGSLASENVVHMCGSGVSACHNILAMEIAGFHAPRLYIGSWSEWTTDPSRPVVTGDA